MRIVIIGSCTQKKQYTPKEMATCADLDDSAIRRQKVFDLQAYMLPAIEMYKGRQHLYTKEAFQNLRNILGENQVKFYILSAGYGLIPYDAEIVPYECSLRNLGTKKIRARGKVLGCPTVFREVTVGSDLIFVLLGEQYLYLLDLPLVLPPEPKYLFLCGNGARKLLPNQSNVFHIKTCLEETKKFQVPLVDLKGLLLKRLSQRVLQFQDVLEELFIAPENFLSLLS